MTDTISRDELQAKITRGDQFALFEVLPTMYWRKHHLPGAVSLPPDQVATLVPQQVPDKSTEIVLYCWDLRCPTAGQAAQELAALGYTNIKEYSAGKQDWLDAGLAMERAADRRGGAARDASIAAEASAPGNAPQEQD